MTESQKAEFHKRTSNAMKKAKIRKALQGNGAVMRMGAICRKPDKYNYREIFKSKKG